jgi:hypothetical protein
VPRFVLARLVALLALSLTLTAPALRADTLALSGVVQDPSGRPLPNQSFRLVLGSDAAPRAPGSGRMLRTDARGRFALRAPVSLPARRIRLDSLLARHDSRLLELGFEFDLLGQPALYWVEVDFTRHGPVRGIGAFVRGRGGLFDLPLTFHAPEHAWSVPGDPRGMRLTGIGANVLIEGANDGAGEVWQIDLVVTRHMFQMR